MAGGMNRGGEYGAMAGRVARAAATDPRPRDPPIWHCWVTDSNGRLPGLLFWWRQVEGEWRGRVVHPVQDEAGWAVVEEWLPAALLDPA
jgi:hypothetical protein